MNGQDVTAVWLRRVDGKDQVLVEINGIWHVAIEEHAELQHSHVAEAPAFAAGREVFP